LVRIRLTANDRPTIAGRQMFDRLKGKANKLGMASNRHSVVGGPERVGRVLNNLDVVLLADSIEFTDIGRVTTPMHGDYGFGSLRYLAFDVQRIDVPGRGIDVGPNDSGTRGHNRNIC